MQTRRRGSRIRVGARLAWWFTVVLANLASPHTSPAQSLGVTPSTSYVVDVNSIESLAVSGRTAWFAGSFTRVFRPAEGLVRTDTITGAQIGTPTPIESGLTTCAVADGFGGWFIGGQFYFVAGLFRPGVAHILPDGSVDAAWDAALVMTQISGASAGIWALALDAGVLYIGGTLVSAGGLPRYGIAAVSAADGTVLPWNASLTPAPVFPQGSAVLSIALHSGAVYVAGAFTGAWGQPRTGLAALDQTTGAVLPWYPGATTNARALAASGSTVWIGGNFTSIGGVTRSRLAAADATSGALTPWAPAADGTVRVLAATGNMVIAGGEFGSIAGVTRVRLAALDASTAAVLPWNAQLNPSSQLPTQISVVTTLELTASTVRIGGTFTAAGGQPRRGLAELDLTTALASPWNPSPGAMPQYTFATSGTTVLLRTSGIGSRPRNSLAAVDLAAGIQIETVPTVAGTVHAVTVVGSTLYLGGEFTAIDGVPRTNLAAIDLTTGAVSSWNPGTSAVSPGLPNRVRGLRVRGSDLFIVGEFDYVGGTPRSGLASVDIQSGAVLPWDPGLTFATSGFRGMEVAGDTVWVHGNFVEWGRRNLVAFDAATGAVRPFDAAVEGGSFVSSVCVAESTVYLSGDFASLGGVSRVGLAEVDRTSGALTGWPTPILTAPAFPPVPYYPGAATGMVLAGPSLLVGGTFSTAGGLPRAGLAEIDRATGVVSSWAPTSNGLAPACAAIANGELLVRGSALLTFPVLRAPASTAIAGSGCGPLPVNPYLEATLPVIGNTWSWSVTTSPGLHGQTYVSLVPATSWDAGNGCLVHLDLPSLSLLAEFTTSASGVASSTVPLPLLAAAWGFTLRAQSGVLLPGSFALSNALDVVLGY